MDVLLSNEQISGVNLRSCSLLTKASDISATCTFGLPGPYPPSAHQCPVIHSAEACRQTTIAVREVVGYVPISLNTRCDGEGKITSAAIIADLNRYIFSIEP